MSGIFKIGGYIVAPSHGLGKLTNRIFHKIEGKDIEMLEFYFENDKMTMLVPFNKVHSMGIRLPIPLGEVDRVYSLLKEDSRGMRVIWSKRSREYNKKILTGDIFAISEVIRDLYKNTNNPNRSYSERIIFENAMQRVVEEIAVVVGSSSEAIETKITNILSKYHETYQDSIEKDETTEIDEDFEQIPQGF